ncbi:MAG: transcriptional repressor LexA [Chloroflexi bacterium]|nr:transcriptional repressor LexA [Chloroflexota bacterium]
MNYQKGENRQREAMKFIIRFQRKNGYPPHVRDLCEGIGIKSPSHAQKLLKQLEDRDLITRESSKSRAIRILDAAYEFAGQAGRRMDEALTVPLLGRIVASQPIPMPDSSFNYYDAESFVTVPGSTFSQADRDNGLFALEVQGDSMIDSMVNDGDTVILRRIENAENGDMVAVWLKDRQETTLKHFIRKDEKIILRPANPAMADIEVENPDQLEIQGRVVMVIRQYL